MEISYTKYRFYRECPWKYKLAFVDQRQVPLNAKSSYGLSMHRALEHWLKLDGWVRPGRVTPPRKTRPQSEWQRRKSEHPSSSEIH